MFLIKGAFFLLLNAYICVIARSQTVRVCNDYVDIAFLVDVSGSIETERNATGYFKNQIKPFLKGCVGMLNVGPGKVQVGVVTFGNNGYVQFTLTSNVNDIMRGIDNIVYPNKELYSETTNTPAGILIASTQVLGYNSPNYRPNATRICIIVTDGQTTCNPEYSIRYANDAKNLGVIIFSVGCTPNINVKELVGIASTLPGLNISMIDEAIANHTFGFSRAVAYFPTIEDRNGVVQQVSNYVGQANCTQATTIVTATCKDTADWCNSASMKPVNCYDPSTERICCRFCKTNLISLGLPYSCRYGDYYSGCTAQSCADNYAKCCATCTLFECRDYGDWCSTLFLGSCYNFQAEQQTCCKSCRMRSTGNPVCRYGDAYPWCKPEYCTDAYPGVNLGCCSTCPNATCIDYSPSCNSMFPGNCYDSQIEKMCCRSCRNKLSADLLCRYGDQYDWCATQFCGDYTRNCCRTCPKYIPRL